MRYRELLLEYNREITARQTGDKLIASFVNDHSLAMPPNLAETLRKLRLIKRSGALDLLSQDQKNIIINDILAYIEQKDPTPNKAYTPWLARMYAKSTNGGFPLEDMNRDDLVRMYDIAKKRRMLKPEHTDINNFKSYSQFEDTMENAYNNFDDLEADMMPEGKATKVYEDGNVLVVVPHDEAAACKYGRGTRWCTAATRGANYFDNYNRQGNLYILIPKKPEHQGEKYQLHFPSNQYMDENDDPVILTDILLRRFADKNLLDYFLKAEPEMGNLIQFADNDRINKSMEKLADLVMDKVYEVITDWEMQDPYYYQWLKEKGYVYPEGHENEFEIDWDKVAEDPEAGFLEYNYEAKEYLDKMQEILHMPAEKIKDQATHLENEGLISPEKPAQLDELEELVANMIRYRFLDRRGHSNDGGVSDFITRNIIMVRDGDSYKPTYIKRNRS